MSKTVQKKWVDPLESAERIFLKAIRQNPDVNKYVLGVSGGTDSVVAAQLSVEFANMYGVDLDKFVVMHANTGTAIPQSKLVAKVFAEMHGLDYVEAGPRNPQDYLAVRVLDNGWAGQYGGSPATGGHGLEWANRKNKPMQAVYMMFEGKQLWFSGTRVTESKKRSVNLGSRAIDKDDQSPRRTWVSLIYSWDSSDKVEFIKDRRLPVSEAYEILGYSGECTACAYDDKGLLNDIGLLSPELAYCLKTLAVWVGLRAVRGDIDIDPKQLCWGWDPETDGDEDTDKTQKELVPLAEGDVLNGGGNKIGEYEIPDSVNETTAQQMVGCAGGGCSTRQSPPWVSDLPREQIVTREDTFIAWNDSAAAVSERFA